MQYRQIGTKHAYHLVHPAADDSEDWRTMYRTVSFSVVGMGDHHRGVWHLHGHSHGHLINPGYYSRKVLDVGVDAHPAFRPYSLGEIADIMERRTVAKIDHH